MDVGCWNIPITHTTLKFENLNLNLLNYRMLHLPEKLAHQGNGIIVKFHQGAYKIEKPFLNQEPYIK
jgi:hypothetical protein